MELRIVQQYLELKLALKEGEELLWLLENRLSKLTSPQNLKVQDYGIKIHNTIKYYAAKDIYEEINIITDQILLQKSFVNELTVKIKNIENEVLRFIGDSNAVELKVFYYHYIKQLTLSEVARMMNYSYRQIRRIKNKLINLNEGGEND